MSEKQEKKSIWDKFPFIQKLKSIKGVQYIILGIFVLILGVIFLSTKSQSNQNVVSSSDLTAEAYA